MSNQRQDKKTPTAISPTPLRDWIQKQSLSMQLALILLMGACIACGARVSINFSDSPVPANLQLLFAILSGICLGSRYGALTGVTYLLGASAMHAFWPLNSGANPLTGMMAGYLWSLPLIGYVTGRIVERLGRENFATYMMGSLTGIAVYDAIGPVRMMGATEMDPVSAGLKGAVIFLGLHLSHAFAAAIMTTAASSTASARSNQ
ncbi:MAG: biotin transporter BioY [Chthonomonadales bacterium]